MAEASDDPVPGGDHPPVELLVPGDGGFEVSSRRTIAYAEVGQPDPPSSGASDIHPRRFRGRGGAGGSVGGTAPG